MYNWQGYTLYSPFYFSAKVGILRGLPHLAGQLFQAGQLSTESLSEQRQAELDQLSLEERMLLCNLNRKYKEKFGFPFVICARMNKKEAIIEGLKDRYHNSMEIEIQNAIQEVMKISKLRFQDIVQSTSKL